MTDRVAKAARQDVYALIDRRFDEFVEELRPTPGCRRSARARGRGRGADATRSLLERHGIPARLMDVPGGPPMVIGEVPGASSAPPLILCNHYDVQPVDPIEQWRRAPFDPVVEDGKLFARGVADTKGNTAAQAYAQAAVREVVRHRAREPSIHDRGRRRGRAVHICQRSRASTLPSSRGPARRSKARGTTPQGVPEVYLGSKGILYVELQGPDGRRRSAQLARRVAAEPRLATLEALRVIRDSRGRILIPGFYDGVPRPTTRGPGPPPEESIRPARMAEGVRGHGGLRRQDAARAPDRLLLQPDLQHRRDRVRLHGAGQQDHQPCPRGGEARFSPGAGPAAAPHSRRAEGTPSAARGSATSR